MTAVIETTQLRPAIAANIVRLRKAKGVSQQDLATRVGITPVHLNRIENCKSSPSAELLFSLADALEATADSLRQIPLLPVDES